MPVDGIQSKRNNHNGAVVASTIAGAGAGTYFALKSVPKDSFEKFAKEANPKGVIEDFTHLINIDKAKKALQDKKITQKTYDKLTEFSKSFSESFKKIKSIKEVPTQLEESAGVLWKNLTTFWGKVGKEVKDLDIVNTKIAEKIHTNSISSAKKLFELLKKPLAKYAGAGAAVGLVLALLLNGSSNKEA